MTARKTELLARQLSKHYPNCPFCSAGAPEHKGTKWSPSVPFSPPPPPSDSVNSKTQLDHLKRRSRVAAVSPAWGAGAPATPKSQDDLGVWPDLLPLPYGAHGKSREVAPTHQTSEQRERQETRAKARRYFFIFSSFFPLPGGGTSSPQQSLPRPRWRSRSRSARLGPRVRRAVALGERFRGGLPPARPPRKAHGSADRDASSQGRSGDCRRRRWVRPLARARLLRPSPPLPPHPRPTRSSPRSVLPATNGRRVLASQQPMAARAPTPRTPLSWKETRHPRPSPLSTPGSARATPPPLTKLPSDSTAAQPTRVPPTCWRSNRKSCDPRLSAFEWAAPLAARAASSHGRLGVVVLLPEPLF